MFGIVKLNVVYFVSLILVSFIFPNQIYLISITAFFTGSVQMTEEISF